MSLSHPEDIARRQAIESEIKIAERRLREQAVALAEPKRIHGAWDYWDNLNVRNC